MSNAFLPSSMTGYARNQAESQYPECWDGLVGYWDFSVQGAIPLLGQADDLSGYGNHGTLVGGAHSVAGGKFGAPLVFGGAADWVNAGNHESLNVSSYSFAVSAWFISSNSSTYILPIVSKFENQINEWWTIVLNGDHSSNRYGEVGFATDDGAAKTTLDTVAATYNDNKWHHVVGQRNATHIELYIDGVFDSSADVSAQGSFDDPGSNLRIGKDQGNTIYFDGQIDNVSIYNRVFLSPSQVAFLFAHPRALVTPRHRTIVTVPAGAIVNVAGQADSISSSTAGFRRQRIAAAQADSASSSLAGFRRLRVAAAQADSASSSLAGFRRLNRPGAGQADSLSQTYAAMTVGPVLALEELFRHRRFRLSSTYARKSFKGVF